jgi:hypothetical protein
VKSGAGSPTFSSAARAPVTLAAIRTKARVEIIFVIEGASLKASRVVIPGIISCSVTGIAAAVLGALFIAALNTFGDFVWARFIPAHRPVFGLAHGTLLCLGIGLFLGARRRLAARGAVAGALIGFAAAGGYYLLARFMGYAAMFLLWMALWAAFGVLDGTALGEPRRPFSSALGRGALAALGSGAAFYMVSGIWRRTPAGLGDYAYHFACWTIAFLPGFVALLLHKTRR